MDFEEISIAHIPDKNPVPSNPVTRSKISPPGPDEHYSK